MIPLFVGDALEHPQGPLGAPGPHFENHQHTLINKTCRMIHLRLIKWHFKLCILGISNPQMFIKYFVTNYILFFSAQQSTNYKRVKSK